MASAAGGPSSGTDISRPDPLTAAARRRLGRPISHFDAQIVAIARSRAAALATPNVADFADCGVTVLDPWTLKEQNR
jgi:hypothetical protein